MEYCPWREKSHVNVRLKALLSFELSVGSIENSSPKATKCLCAFLTILNFNSFWQWVPPPPSSLSFFLYVYTLEAHHKGGKRKKDPEIRRIPFCLMFRKHELRFLFLSSVVTAIIEATE